MTDFLPSALADETLLPSLVAEFGLPLHVMFTEEFARAAADFRRAADACYPNCLIVFAVKSNPCRGAIRLAHQSELGADVVSEFELQAALAEGLSATRIIGNGNAKSDDYVDLAVRSGTLIAADSLEEVNLIAAAADRIGTRARVLIRLSGMTLDGLTAADQSTAAHWTKFGIPIGKWRDFVTLTRSLPFIDPVGISAHVGTQVCDPAGYERLMTALVGVMESAAAEGWRMRMLDIGGGYPLSYLSKGEWITFQARLRQQIAGELPASEWVTWGEMPMGYAHVKGRPPTGADEWCGKSYWSPLTGARMLEHLLRFRSNGEASVAERLQAAGNPTLIVEPGRALIGPAGVTLAQVIGTKEVEGNRVVILDLGTVNHGTALVTPDIYPMLIWPPRPDDRPIEAFVAGRLCFTGDMISKMKIPLNRLPARGEMIVIAMTGAYCADHFASNSCGYPRPAKVAVAADGSVEVWRRADLKVASGKGGKDGA